MPNENEIIRMHISWYFILSDFVFQAEVSFTSILLFCMLFAIPSKMMDLCLQMP